MQNRIAVGTVILPEGEHNQHIIARRKADTADKKQEQRPAGLDECACRRAGCHKQNAADIDHAERRNSARAHLLGIRVKTGRAQRHHRDGDCIQPRRRAERQNCKNVDNMPQEKRHRASRKEQPMQLFRQESQRQQQIAQHSERQSRHDIPLVHARPHPPQFQQPQQHEHHRSRRLEHHRRNIAPLIRAHDEQRLQYRARTDEQDLQHPPLPPFRVFFLLAYFTMSAAPLSTLRI